VDVEDEEPIFETYLVKEKKMSQLNFEQIKNLEKTPSSTYLEWTAKIDVLTHTGDPYGSAYKHLSLTVHELHA